MPTATSLTGSEINQEKILQCLTLGNTKEVNKCMQEQDPKRKILERGMRCMHNGECGESNKTGKKKKGKGKGKGKVQVNTEQNGHQM